MDYTTGISLITNEVYLGSTSAIFALADLRRDGITHVLKLYFDEPGWPEDFVVCDSPIDDGVFIDWEILEQGVTFIREAAAAGQKVLVVCGLGISRSATFVLAYLLDQGYDLHDAFNLVHSARPQVWPAHALWESLITHYNLPYTLDQVQEWYEGSRLA